MSAASFARRRRSERGARGHRVRAERLHVLLGMRAAVLRGGRDRRRRPVDRPVTGSAPCQRHRRPPASGGRRHRPRAAQALGRRPPPREPSTSKRSTSSSSPPARRRSAPTSRVSNARGVHGIQTIATASNCTTTSRARRDRAVVVGGGYIGLEMAEAMKKRGMTVTIVEAAPQPMSTLDPDMGALVAEAIRSIGIELQHRHGGDGVRNRRGRACPCGRHRRPGHSRPTSSCSGSACKPNERDGRGCRNRDRPSAAASSTNRRQETSAEGVWAAGDCVETFHRIASQAGRDRARHACEQARARSSGINATGGDAAFRRSDRHRDHQDLRQRDRPHGPRRNARPTLGLRLSRPRRIEGTTRAGYYPARRRSR